MPEMLEEKGYTKAILKGTQYRQDDFTDQVILNIIVSSDSKKPVQSAMMNYFSFQCPNSYYSIDHLDNKIKNRDISPNLSYPRYWFGSASVGRILLLAMSYQEIKWFLCFISTLLFLFFTVKIVNRIGWIKSLPIFLALLFANFFVTQFSIQFFPVMAIALIGGTWMCKNGLKPQKKLTLFLFITGMFTAYFDLLTTPILTLGLPLIVYLLLQQKEKQTMYDILKSIVILGIFWFIGYASAWAIKWVLAAILVDSTFIAGTFQIMNYRTSADNFTRWDALARNFKLMPIIGLSLVLTLLLLLTFFSFNRKGISWAITFLLVGMLPYLWFGVFSNHSYLHLLFTYRAQIISMSCAMLCLVSLIDWDRLKAKLKKKQYIFNYE
jgi:hypothetical protein